MFLMSADNDFQIRKLVKVSQWKWLQTDIAYICKFPRSVRSLKMTLAELTINLDFFLAPPPFFAVTVSHPAAKKKGNN